MKTLAVTSLLLGTSLVLGSTAADLGVGGAPDDAELPPSHSSRASVSSLAAAGPDDVIEGTCQRCHNENRLRGNLSLEGFTVAEAASSPENTEIAERMIRKLRAGMMPPPGVRRPQGDTLLQLVEALEQTVDAAWARNPKPGGRPFQRLNRPEYEGAIRDLLGLRVDAGAWLPLDTKSANFDNIADAQALSPLLLQGYLNAASEISRWAVGDPDAPAIDVTYKNSEYVSQHPWDRVEGAPYGTRGGIVVNHVFPADGSYEFGLTFSAGDESQLQDIDISIDGERATLLAYTRSGAGADGRGGDGLRTGRIFVPAGQHRVSAAFIRRAEGPYEDLIRPHEWSLAGGGSGGDGITTLPHLRDLVIGGPYDATGVSESISRERIFTCRPTRMSEEMSCAREIIARLASEAYRRPVTDAEIDGLMWFYEDASQREGFEEGVRAALQAILSSPFFVLRIEERPEGVEPGEIYVLEDADLASRLAFFLWGALPDEELLQAAAEGRLSGPAALERQARRMLEDPRSEALGRRFAAQWLRLQDLYKVHPDPNFYPDFDENLADLMHRETEMFFNHLVREDRDAMELITADYTFVNERLARHYGLKGVAGREFRRVEYPDDGTRSGLLGHGSVLVQTSMANRTSPVLRGKWVMEVLLGTPPPPPPPDVPDLEETEGVVDGAFLTTRQRLEVHRAAPTCRSCHRFMDPIGLALDNFDVTAKWRLRENGVPLDTRGEFYDGTMISTPGQLAGVLAKRPIPIMRTLTENLMAYAVGRRMEYYDQPAIRQIVRAAEENGEYRMSDLILGVVRSDAFRMKRAGNVTAEEDMGNGS